MRMIFVEFVWLFALFHTKNLRKQKKRNGNYPKEKIIYALNTSYRIRPITIGSVEPVVEPTPSSMTWPPTNRMVRKIVTFVPGLVSIFEAILTDAIARTYNKLVLGVN